MTKRWQIFAALAVLYILAYFYRVSMAVIAHDLADSLALSATQLGTLSGVLFYAFALSQLPLGPLLDRFGGRRLISATGVITTAGSLLFAYAPGYPAALAGRILLGIGTSCVLMGSYKIFTNWFTPREFVVVAGLIMAVGNLGNLSATAPLALLVGKLGWRGAFLAVGILQAAVTILVFLLVRDHPAADEAPEGMAGYGAAPQPVDTLQGWRIVFSSGSFWLLALLAFFWYANYMVLQGLWGGPYLMEVMGLSRNAAGSLLLCTALGYIVGSLLIGRVSNDLLKSRKITLLVGQSLFLALMTLMLGPAEHLSRPQLSVAFFLIGLAVSSGVMIYPMAKETFPAGISATAMTAVNFFVLTGAAVAQQLTGWYIERFPRGATGYPAEAYHGAFLLSIGGLAVAICLFFCASETGPESGKPADRSGKA